MAERERHWLRKTDFDGQGGTEGPRVSKAPDGQARLIVDPMDNVLLGTQNICRYMGIASLVTFYRYVDEFAFPAVKRPDGMWMTTMTAIDDWVVMCAAAVRENRKIGRSTNHSPEEDLAAAEKRLAEAQARVEAAEARKAKGDKRYDRSGTQANSGHANDSTEVDERSS